MGTNTIRKFKKHNSQDMQIQQTQLSQVCVDAVCDENEVCVDAVCDENEVYKLLVFFCGLPGCGKSTLSCHFRDELRRLLGDRCLVTVCHKDKIGQQYEGLTPDGFADKFADEMHHTAESASGREKCHVVFIDMNINPRYIHEIMERFKSDKKSVPNEVLVLHVSGEIERNAYAFKCMQAACITRANSRNFDESDERWSSLHRDNALVAINSKYWGTPPSEGGCGLATKGLVDKVIKKEIQNLACCVRFEEYPVPMLKGSALENASGEKNECTGLPVEWTEDNVLAPDSDAIKSLVERVLGTVECQLE